jgi:hypothetical protein
MSALSTLYSVIKFTVYVVMSIYHYTHTLLNQPLIEGLYHKITHLKVPHGTRREYQIILGLLNLYFFGAGTAVAGLMQKDLSHSVIGIAQLFFPGAGWMWSIFWGLKMILGR